MTLCAVLPCLVRVEPGATWCGIHAATLEGQHEVSHRLDGHSKAIDGCPVCRDPDGWLRKQTQKEAEPYTSWTKDCPARGGGLKHAHWNECQGEHPGTGAKHDRWTCCHCERHIGA